MGNVLTMKFLALDKISSKPALPAGKFVSTTIWENMEAAVTNQKTGYYQKQIDKFADLQVVAPEFEGFDIPVFDCGNGE